MEVRTQAKLANSSLARELQPLRERLQASIAKTMEGRSEPLTVAPGVIMAHSMSPLPPTAYIYEPSLCICVQGQKTVVLGDEVLRYDENHYLLTCVDIPTIVSVAKASKKTPYSGMLIRLEMDVVRSIILEMETSGAPVEHDEPGVAIRALSAPLLEAICRLAELTASQRDIPVMAPLIQREILYRLLSGPSGDRLRGIAQLGSQSNRVEKAANWIRKNFAKRFSIPEMARRTGMGVSTFHRRFQELTTMSPLQYQKHLRLHEARRLMLIENEDAASSAIRVGYESVTQFNREYRRLFGAPPATDKRKLISAGQIVATVV